MYPVLDQYKGTSGPGIPPVNCVSPEPSAFMVTTSYEALMYCEKAILVPSGDHTGEADCQAASVPAMIVWLEPSAFIVAIFNTPERSATQAICFARGRETPGE